MPNGVKEERDNNILVIFDGTVEGSLSSEKEGEAGMYLQERLGFEKVQLKQMEGEVVAAKAWDGGGRQLVALHLDPVFAAASESFPCPTTKNVPPFSRRGLLPADDLSLGLSACLPLHDYFC